MKRALFIIGLLCSNLLFAADHEVQLKSSINQVIVYQQGAQVERTAKALIQPGINLVIFGGLQTSLDPNLIRPATSGTSLRRPSTSAALVATRFAKLPQLEFVDRNDLNSFSASGIDRLKSHWSTTLEEDGVYFSSHESLMSAVFGLAPLAATLRKRGSSGALTGVAYVPPDCSHEVASEHCCVVHLGANFARVSRGAGKMRTVSNALVFHFAPRADTPVSGG